MFKLLVFRLAHSVEKQLDHEKRYFGTLLVCFSQTFSRLRQSANLGLPRIIRILAKNIASQSVCIKTLSYIDGAK